MEKLWASADEAINDIRDGSSILVGGFGDSGFPQALVAALQRRSPSDLRIVHNGAAFGSLVTDGRIRRLICSYPVGPSSVSILPDLEAGNIELEVIPQGTLVERVRAGAAGLGGVLTRVGVDLAAWSPIAPEFIDLDGERYILARPIRGNFALIRGDIADLLGNVVCRKAARNFNPVMAMAAETTIVEVRQVVEPGKLDPERIDIPAPFVDRIVVAGMVQESQRAVV